MTSMEGTLYILEGYIVKKCNWVQIKSKGNS